MNAECVSSLQVVPDVIVQVTVVAVPLSRAVIVAVFDALASTLRWLIVVPPVGIGPNTRSSLLAANPVLMQAAGIAPKLFANGMHSVLFFPTGLPAPPNVAIALVPLDPAAPVAPVSPLPVGPVGPVAPPPGPVAPVSPLFPVSPLLPVGPV